MNRKNQVLATSLSLLLSVGMSGGTILPAYAMENAENTEVQTDVATNGNAEQSENGAQSQKEATPEAKEKTSNQAAAQSSSLPDSSKSVKANSADEEEGEGESTSKGVAVDEKHFPDEGFRKYVSAVFDEDKNDYLSDEEIESATIIELDYMYDGGMGDSDNVVNDLLDQINDVRGIEYLSNLQYLTINMDRTCQKMSDIDLSYNTELTTLTIGPNNDDDYDGVAANTTLKKINIKKCKNLETLDIMKCSAIDSLEFPENESLRSLSIKDCDNIKNIDFSKCAGLESLTINSDSITNLDLSECTLLANLYLECKNLMAVDLTKCTQLNSIELFCAKLETMDLSKCSQLTNLRIRSDSLHSLNLNACTDLTSLDLECEKLSSLDVTQSSQLTELSITSAQLSSIDLNACKELTDLSLDCKKLDSVNLSKCTQLTSLGLYDGKYPTVDLSNNTELDFLGLYGKSIKTIDLSKNTKLTNICVSGSGLTSLDLSKNTKLETFTNDDMYYEPAPIESLDFSNAPELVYLYLNGSPLKNLNIKKNAKLEEINLRNTGIKNIDLSSNGNLSYLDISHTGITSLDVSKNTKLYQLYVSDTGITSLDISNNKELTDINVKNTPIKNFKNADFSGHAELGEMYLDNVGVESIVFDDKQEIRSLSIKGNHVKEMKLENHRPSYKDGVDFNADNQTPTITLEPNQIKNNTVALSDLFSDVSRVTIEKGEGYTYDADAKTITFQDKNNRKFKYTWDTKLFDDGSALLKGTATIQVPNEPEEKPDPKPEVKYDTLTKIKLGTTRYTYDGKVKKPSVSAYIGSTRADASKYKVTYPTGMKNIGSYTVKVTGNQSKFCKGTLTATYRIDPKKVKTPSAKVGKKKVTVKWTKVAGGVKYQMAIAKKGGKYKTYAVSGNSKTVKKLTSKKKYTVKVRAYKKVGKKTYYGDWSKIKTVKVK